ncbi:uncharacterized protein F4812DRAFT_408918 [Daldinia caldariorum]|uniref:uncharacterized protein n=1 Tax=Daldinia caldariorum TaxID=326644 RepID=UPI002008956B|nr:uncharacterized protein F4812DRAFT_408918 [Daldinia caldariorum]KAI1472443.1 hypothetical protein F4812DRAFT_408918 [Daldinia caldariorum]
MFLFLFFCFFCFFGICFGICFGVITFFAWVGGLDLEDMAWRIELGFRSFVIYIISGGVLLVCGNI